MEVTLKIHRSNPDTGETGVDEFTVDAPETATLLDCLDQIKDEQDGSLTLPQELSDGGLRLVWHADERRRCAGL